MCEALEFFLKRFNSLKYFYVAGYQCAHAGRVNRPINDKCKSNSMGECQAMGECPTTRSHLLLSPIKPIYQ